MATAALLNVTPKFQRCDAVTAAWEGGYSDHPDDPGGKTDRGITQATLNGYTDAKGLPRQTVKGISRELAARIFFEEFWTKAKCEGLAIGVDLATYDSSVNSGVSRGRQWLLASVGGTPADTVKKICAKRLGFMQSLNIWNTFGNGWSRRVADIEARGVSWALAVSNDNHVVVQQLDDEASKATKTAVQQGKVSIGVGTGTTGTGVVAVDNADQVAGLLLGGLVVVGVLVVGYLIIRAVINSHRAEAYAVAAREVGAAS